MFIRFYLTENWTVLTVKFIALPAFFYFWTQIAPISAINMSGIEYCYEYSHKDQHRSLESETSENIQSVKFGR